MKKIQKEDIEEYIRLWNVPEINKALDNDFPAENLCLVGLKDALSEAIIRKSEFVFKKIIEKPYDFNKNKFLYLHHAVRTHEKYFVEKLLEKMSWEQINETETISQDNALHVACQENLPEIIILLSKHGVNWNHLNHLKQTPLHILLRNNNQLSSELSKELSIRQINIGLKDIMGISCKDIIKSFSYDKKWLSKKENRELLKIFNLKPATL